MPTRVEWIERWEYDVVKVSRLPVPNEIRKPACMIGWKVRLRRHLRRRLPWLVLRQDPRDCCWHHQIDWRRAAAVAVRLVRDAHAAGIRDGACINDYVMDRVSDLGAREETALILLVGTSAGIQLHEPDAPWHYIDGQHRVAAQLDQGVPETIVQRLELLDPTTGQPADD